MGYVHSSWSLVVLGFILEDGEALLRRSRAGMQGVDEFNTPLVFEGVLAATSRRVVFVEFGRLDKAAISGLRSLAENFLGSGVYESPFVRRFKGEISIPLNALRRVGRGGRSVRSLGRETLELVYGVVRVRFQLPLGQSVAEWVSIVSEAARRGEVYTGFPRVSFWLQGVGGSFDIVEKGDIDFAGALEVVEWVAGQPEQGGGGCPLTVGFTRGNSSVEASGSGGDLFFRYICEDGDFSGFLSLSQVEECILDFFNGREPRYLKLLKKS